MGDPVREHAGRSGRRFDCRFAEWHRNSKATKAESNHHIEAVAAESWNLDFGLKYGWLCRFVEVKSQERKRQLN